MSASKFQPGDEVKLVSDNTRMTVHEITDLGIGVVYMHDGKIVHDVVPPVALVKIVRANDVPPTLAKR